MIGEALGIDGAELLQDGEARDVVVGLDDAIGQR